MTFYIGEVIETEDGEFAVQLPINMIKQMGWDEHTLLEWIIDEEEHVFLKESEHDGDSKSGD